MKAESIIISGPSGVGKSTISSILSDDYSFRVVQSVTTREERADDRKGRYEYIDESEYNRLKENDELFIWAEYGNEFYGVKKSKYYPTLNSDDTPILVITPESAVECIIENEDVDEKRFLSIFIDSTDNEINTRLEGRDGDVEEGESSRREDDRRFKKKFIYQLENRNLQDTVDAIRMIWEHRDRSGILPREYIEGLINCGSLIKENPDIGSISHASYDLRLGDEYYHGGEIQKLDTYNPYITIEPYDYAIVMSKETVSMPRDIAGRFDLTVSLFCQGVILSNGPQIDPGFEGRLFCLLFNTSDGKVQLGRGDKYATLETRKLIAPTDPYDGSYQKKEHIQDYLPELRMQGAISQLKEEIDQMKQERERLQQVVFTRNITIALGFVSFILALIAILVALLSSGL